MSNLPDCNVYPELITLAGDCKRASDFGRVLAKLTEFADAAGCVVWEKFHAGNNERRYFMLADHFPAEAGRPVWHFLPRLSETGEAVEKEEFRLVRDIETAEADGKHVPRIDLLRERGIQAFCAIPVNFGPRREAAVSLYWRTKEIPSDERLISIQQAAKVIPALKHAVLNQMGYDLLRKVESELNKNPLNKNPLNKNPGKSDAETDEIMQKVLEAVKDSFNAKEAMLYLEDRTKRPNEYTLRARIWPWKTFSPSESYSPLSVGLTHWTISQKKTLRFVDLQHFENERDALARDAVEQGQPELGNSYAQLNWPTRDLLVPEATQQLGDPLPPLSFLCVPIPDGERMVGALRCCCTAEARYPFDERHRQILELVAEQIGHWWGNHITLRQEQAETQTFRNLVQGITAMHDIAFRSLTDRERPKMKPLWDRSLELLSAVAPWPDALSIRIVQDGALHFTGHAGPRWSEGNAKQQRERLETTYLLSQREWAGCRAIAERKVLLEKEPGRAGGLRSQLFPDAKRLLHAPILWGKEPVGVIDIRGFDDREIPSHLPLTCELIGRQLGMYANLQDLFWGLNESKAQLAEEREQQNQIYEDFVHQLRNPLVKAGHFAEQIDGARSPELQQLLTHLRHASLFADTINHFVSLSKGLNPEVQWKAMRFEEIVPLVQQMAKDQQTVAAHRKITFVVDEGSFAALYRIGVYYSHDLFLHCLFNLLDNASKYSKKKSEVQIRARYDEFQKRFLLSVNNQISPHGHRIDSRDRNRLIQRGERGDHAVLTTAGGRGIGLWIVARFMAAINGDLQIQPTDSRDRNTFSLSFRVGIPKGVQIES